jgi:hypothetical protein
MATQTDWTGTASQLLGVLGDQAGETVRRGKTWPATPRALSGRLRRAATFLREVGIDIAFPGREGRPRNRTIRIFASPEKAGTRPSKPSAWSATEDNGSDTAPSAFIKPLKSNGGASADGADTKMRG